MVYPDVIVCPSYPFNDTVLISHLQLNNINKNKIMDIRQSMSIFSFVWDSTTIIELKQIFNRVGVTNDNFTADDLLKEVLFYPIFSHFKT
jgi:hypothetical protein